MNGREWLFRHSHWKYELKIATVRDYANCNVYERGLVKLTFFNSLESYSTYILEGLISDFWTTAKKKSCRHLISYLFGFIYAMHDRTFELKV